MEKIKFIYKYAKRYQLQMLTMLIIICITTLIVAMYPYIFGKLIDALYYQRNMQAFLKTSVIYCIIFIINQILHFTLQMTYANLQTKFIFDMKKSILRRCLAYKGEKLANMETGDIISRINKDTDEVMKFIYSDIFYGISSLLDLLACLGMVAYLNRLLALITLVLAIVTFALSQYFSTKLWPINGKLTKLVAKNESWLFEILNAMRDIRLLNATKYCNDKYLENENEIITVSNEKIKQEVIAERCNALVKLVDSLCIYSISAMLIINGNLTLGGMIACIDYFQRITLMLSRLYNRTFSIPSRMVSTERLMEVERGTIEEYHEELAMHHIKNGDIEINNVSFSYSDKKPVLEQMSLTIHAGERVALVGKSGAGKSTLAELLCGIYEINKGEIKIDGRSIKEYNLRDLRKEIGIVHQEMTIFNQSVRFNLIFSNDTNQDEKIWSILKLVKLDKAIREMSQGLDTIIDSTKIILSGGQKQRLMLARMYIKEPKIIILDEATSSLDERTEYDITEEWENLFKGRTVLSIAHRFSTIMKSDRVAYLEDGKIIASAEHHQLLKVCPQYKHLFLTQEWYDNSRKGEQIIEENTI